MLYYQQQSWRYCKLSNRSCLYDHKVQSQNLMTLFNRQKDYKWTYRKSFNVRKLSMNSTASSYDRYDRCDRIGRGLENYQTDEDEVGQVDRKILYPHKYNTDEIDVTPMDYRQFREYMEQKRNTHRKKIRYRVEQSKKYKELAKKLEAERIKAGVLVEVDVDNLPWNNKARLLSVQKKDYDYKKNRRAEIMKEWLSKANQERGLEGMKREDWELLKGREKQELFKAHRVPSPARARLVMSKETLSHYKKRYLNIPVDFTLDLEIGIAEDIIKRIKKKLRAMGIAKIEFQSEMQFIPQNVWRELEDRSGGIVIWYSKGQLLLAKQKNCEKHSARLQRN
eukprot:TRINITY_DN10384_c1_g1_i13.p1 TRINITY_DN10384_c1_g1~~TRINITY_DN10384_c1_g1_i13.p1  ORF type:complete len:337 (-),score=19.43 TRINITY_DN10384_c1_g1_i13:782-1792(-)